MVADNFLNAPPKTRSASQLAKATTKELHLDWKTIETCVETLAYMVEPLGVTDIVGISRGGLIPAVMLSHRLKCALHPIVVESYNERREQSPVVIKSGLPSDLCTKREGVIIVDDVIDTGNTLNGVTEYLPYARYCALLSKQKMDSIFRVMEVPKDVWVVFPWEPIDNVA